MKKAIWLSLVAALCLAWSGLAWAESAEEAKSDVQKAIAMVKEKGVDETLKAIADPHGPFAKGELYVFAGALDKVIMVAHPYKPDLVNKDLTVFKDTKGKQFFNEFVQVAKNKGSGWVDYYWPKPGAKEPVLKSTYVERVPDQNLYFGAGVYK
jgi:methyl-accepting chemotaxis protein